ncbi:Hypothetical predicted protein [Mytilus galloprovincialis]|uniref:Endonuclease/exonuclease/phosphatase domain-containing protein n=1 Tax=Mytilus galloprovincialis TaxID=29158 RepID=A0A8B6EXD9_MYTGA|nr:Hypothetical predicted protein [Mytilus galloprovincialis]
MNFVNEKFEHNNNDVKEVKSAFNEIRSEKDATNNTIFRLQQDLDDLYDRHIDLQTRSMRENLIFTGIPLQEKDEQTEQTEKIIENFMVEQLKLNRPAEYERAHRFGKEYVERNRDGSVKFATKPIVCRFRNFKERETVRKAARELRDTGFGIKARRQGKKAFFRRDRLFVDGVEFFPPEKTDHQNPGVTRQQPRRNYDDEGARPKLTQGKKTTGDVPRKDIRTTLEAKKDTVRSDQSTDTCDFHLCESNLTVNKTDNIINLLCLNVCVLKNRHKLSNYRSGGIALGYRKYLEKYIKPIETECKFVYWFTIDKKVLHLPENVFIGIVYIPPVNTNYTSEEAFNEIEIELQRFSEKSDYIILVGDFNSRTANLPDFYDEDDIDDFVIDNLTDQSDFTDVYMLDDLNIPRTRNNPDKVVNCYGRKFLEFCKNNKVFILNGRVGQDVIGRPTSRNNSVIDYIICTSHFLRCRSNFEILEFSKLFSDVHSPLKLSLNRVNPTFELHTTELSYQEENKIGKWKFEQVNDFKNNIDEDKIRNVIDELSIYSNQENVTKYEINTAVTNITDILIDSAKATFGTQNFNRNMLNCNKKHNKQW